MAARKATRKRLLLARAAFRPQRGHFLLQPGYLPLLLHIDLGKLVQHADNLAINTGLVADVAVDIIQRKLVRLRAHAAHTLPNPGVLRRR